LAAKKRRKRKKEQRIRRRPVGLWRDESAVAWWGYGGTLRRARLSVLTGLRRLFMFLVMALLDRITLDPAVCHGKPCIRGLRYPVDMLLELMSSGMSSDAILADYEDIQPEDLQAVLLYAARLAKTRSIVALAS